MSNVILTATPEMPPVNVREVLRYMGMRTTDAASVATVEECIAEAASAFRGRVCWRAFDLYLTESTVELGWARVESHSLAKHLDGCQKTVLFAATLGFELDRLIAKYSRLLPSRALCLQALGAERIEALCDAFEQELLLQNEYKDMCLRPRFSPGYGDLPLALQRDIFSALCPARHIGLSLTDSLLMSPSKSVTAILGVASKHSPKE